MKYYCPYDTHIIVDFVLFFSYIRTDSGQTFVEKYKGSEVAVVDSVKFTGNDLGNQACIKAFIQYRVQVSVQTCH